MCIEHRAVCDWVNLIYVHKFVSPSPIMKLLWPNSCKENRACCMLHLIVSCYLLGIRLGI